MDSEADNRTKSWLYRLRYLKMFKNSSNTTEASQISSSVSETTNVSSFRRSTTTNSLNETSPELRRNETNLRKSLRKWHKRMKNCFSKNSLHITRRQSIHIVHELASPGFSRGSGGPDAFQKENIYTLDPSVHKKLTIPISEQSHSNNTSLTPSPSRLTAGSDSQPRSPTFSEVSESSCTPKNEISSLAHHVWYWGPVSKSLVEAKLHGAPDGSFLVRDSASDRHIFSISFRSVGKTLHARIERTSSGYRVFDHKGFDTVKELIEEAVKISLEEGLFCYTKSRADEPNYPVRLLKPISRYDEVRSLQSLSRFVIRQHINVNEIEKLCLPFTLISYLKEENYF